VNLWHSVRCTLAARAVALLGPASLQAGALASVSPSPAGGFSLTFSGAPPVSARVVLACDGASSATRLLCPLEPQAGELLADEGKSVWRGLAPGVAAGGAAFFLRDAEEELLAVTFPAGDGGSSWTVAAKALEGKSKGPADALERLLGVLPPRDPSYEPLERLYRCVEATPAGAIENRLKIRRFGEGAPPFGAATSGLAFLGDAAHPVRPTGEGIALALEDAWALGDVVKRAGGVGPDQLRAYEVGRLPRVRQVSGRVKRVADAYYKGGGGGDEPVEKVERMRMKPL
jgi:2-polyprenyl-6-methoxyphenol hydroxylase-like FAD-dependent oxidoreductase